MVRRGCFGFVRAKPGDGGSRGLPGGGDGGTDYTATVQVPTFHQDQAAFNAEGDKLRAEQATGQLPPSLQAINEQWASDLAANPGKVVKAVSPVHPVPVKAGALCTGWFITPTGYLISAAHCVTKDSSVTQALLAPALPRFITHFYRSSARKWRHNGVPLNQTMINNLRRAGTKWYTEHSSVTGIKASFHVALAVKGTNGQRGAQTVAASVVAAGSAYPGRDYALFKVNGSTNLPTLPLGNDGDLQVGDNLYVDGFPSTVTDNGAFTTQSFQPRRGAPATAGRVRDEIGGEDPFSAPGARQHPCPGDPVTGRCGDQASHLTLVPDRHVGQGRTRSRTRRSRYGRLCV